VRAYLLKEDFQQLWEYAAPSWAGKFLDEWCCQVMRSRIEPMKKIARTLRCRWLPESASKRREVFDGLKRRPV
jgi:transposase